jgi:hypothetical protein
VFLLDTPGISNGKDADAVLARMGKWITSPVKFTLVGIVFVLQTTNAIEGFCRFYGMSHLNYGLDSMRVRIMVALESMSFAKAPIKFRSNLLA